MNCVAYRDHFSAFIEGNLAVSKHDLMQVHLEQCPQCAPQFAQFARAMDVMAEERRQPEDDVQPLGDVMLAELGLPARAPQSGRFQLWGRLPRPARFAAAAAVLAAAGLGFAATGAGQGLMAGWLGLEQGPEGTWVPADGAQRRAVAQSLGAESPDAVAAVPGVRTEVLGGAGFVQQGEQWTTPAAVEAAGHLAAGKKQLDGQWLTPDEYEAALRSRAGLIQVGGRWLTPTELEAKARGEAGQVFLDGRWMPREQAERAVLEARGLQRDGARWVHPDEAKLREQLAAERARIEELSAAVARAERLAAEWRDRGDTGPATPAAEAERQRPANTVVVSHRTHGALSGMLDGLRVLAPVQIGDVILVPLGQSLDHPVAPDSAVLSATQLMSSDVVEINNSGKPRLHNRAQQPVLIMAGEILVGGKQDRLLSADVVVESGGRVELPVFCAEKDRSTAINGVTKFRALSAWGTPALRRLIVSGADQDTVWACIAAHHEDTRTRSATKALAVTYATQGALDARARAKDALDARLRPQDRAVGLAVVRNGAIEVLDVFPDPSFFRGQLESLLAGVTIDTDRFRGRPVVVDAARHAQARALVTTALQRVADAKDARSATIGFAKGPKGADAGKLEIALGADGQPLAGYATLHREEALHLCMVAPLTKAPLSRRAAAAGSRRTGGTTPAPPVPQPPAGDARQRTGSELERAKNLSEAEKRRLKRAQDRKRQQRGGARR